VTPLRMAMALAAIVTLCAAPALADSVDGKPTTRGDRHPRASVRGSPAILFEDRGVGLPPLDTCMTDDGYGRRRSCSAGGGF
jgi:hypothetical protein